MYDLPEMATSKKRSSLRGRAIFGSGCSNTTTSSNPTTSVLASIAHGDGTTQHPGASNGALEKQLQEALQSALRDELQLAIKGMQSELEERFLSSLTRVEHQLVELEGKMPRPRARPLGARRVVNAANGVGDGVDGYINYCI